MPKYPSFWVPYGAFMILMYLAARILINVLDERDELFYANKELTAKLKVITGD